MTDRTGVGNWLRQAENGKPKRRGRESEEDKEAHRAQTRDARDERLKHRPWSSSEAVAEEMAHEAKMLMVVRARKANQGRNDSGLALTPQTKTTP